MLRWTVSRKRSEPALPGEDARLSIGKLISRPIVLLFHPGKFAGRCVHSHPQLGGVTVGSVDDVPEKSIFLPVPFQDIKNRGIGFFLQHFVTAVLLGDGEDFVGVDF
jgi:hypothetical protein